MLKKILPLLFISQITFAQSYYWENYNTDNTGLLTNLVFAITEDSAGNIYLGAQTPGNGGLYKFDGANWEHFTPDNSDLPSFNVDFLLTDKNGIIWIVFGNGFGLTKFDGTSFYSYTTSNSNLTSNNIYNPQLDENNNIWFGQTNNKKITKFDGTNFTDYDLPEVYQGGLFAKDSLLLIGYNFGFMKLNMNTNEIVVYNKGNSSIPGDAVSSITADKNGLVWLGFSSGFSPNNGGIATFDYTNFSTQSAFSISTTWVGPWHNVLTDQNNHVWAASRCEGLKMFDGLNWNQMGTIPNDGCSGTVYLDTKNRIWYADANTGVWVMSEGIPTSTPTTESKLFVNVFPNPATNLIHVSTSIPKKNSAIIEIKNVLGQKVLTAIPISNTSDVSIDVAALKPGIYFINIISNEMQSVIEWMKK